MIKIEIFNLFRYLLYKTYLYTIGNQQVILTATIPVYIIVPEGYPSLAFGMNRMTSSLLYLYTMPP